jgi:hypothetical protein
MDPEDWSGPCADAEPFPMPSPSTARASPSGQGRVKSFVFIENIKVFDLLNPEIDDTCIWTNQSREI